MRLDSGAFMWEEEERKMSVAWCESHGKICAPLRRRRKKYFTKMFRKAFLYWAAGCQGERIDRSRKKKKRKKKMRKGAVRKEDIWS